MTKLVVDSWAAMAFFRKEAAHQKVKTIFDTASAGKLQLFMSVINLAEIYYKLLRKTKRPEAQESIWSLRKIPITIVSASDPLVFEAAELKAKYPIAFADCFAVVLALEEKAPLLTGDPEFKMVEKIVTIKWLK